MSATRNPAASPVDPDEPLRDEVPPTPDEDGPHDVPDDKVIEKTLPTMRIPESDTRPKPAAAATSPSPTS